MRTKQIATLIIPLALLGCLFYWQFGHELTLANLKSSRHLLQSYCNAYPVRTMLLYFLFYIIITTLSFPGAIVVTLAGGALFGLGMGSLLVSFASSIGSTLAFYGARLLLRRPLRKRFASQLQRLDREMAEDGAAYLFMLRLVPVFPFFVVNLLMALTKIRGWTFYWVSQLGMLPCTLLMVNAGTQLASISKISDIFSLPVLLSLVLLGLLPLLTHQAKRIWHKKHPGQLVQADPANDETLQTVQSV
jgi:uncharacterized membrane protein YdjX (TVP38/TMEM64 family)